MQKAGEAVRSMFCVRNKTSDIRVHRTATLTYDLGAILIALLTVKSPKKDKVPRSLGKNKGDMEKVARQLQGDGYSDVWRCKCEVVSIFESRDGSRLYPTCLDAGCWMLCCREVRVRAESEFGARECKLDSCVR